jgi:hypothetical protein
VVTAASSCDRTDNALRRSIHTNWHHIIGFVKLLVLYVPLCGPTVPSTLRGHDDISAALGSYSLDDRYVRTAGSVHLTRVQALVRAFRDRAILDRARGCHTATFVAGYEGSPLAGLDLEIARQRGALDGFDIVHRPAVNEELAVTSVMGTSWQVQLAGSKHGVSPATGTGNLQDSTGLPMLFGTPTGLAPIR